MIEHGYSKAHNHQWVLGFNATNQFYRQTGDLNKAAKFAGIQNPYGNYFPKEREDYIQGIQDFISVVCQQLNQQA